jgi:SAM-dependent methyltransferase
MWPILKKMRRQRAGAKAASGPSEAATLPELEWGAEREADAQVAVRSVPPDWTRYHLARSAQLGDLRGRSVLVVGCNRGDECRYFIELGAAAVTGVDVMSEIGRNFAHASATYLNVSAEKMPLDPNRFDLVFAFATLEHVPDIVPAFREMARVAAPGGYIYSAAAPLWYCRSGPHWVNAFDREPWPHLRLSVDEIVALGRRYIGDGSTDHYHTEAVLRQHLEDPDHMFNRRRPQEYVDACAALEKVEILRNDIELEADRDAHPAIRAELTARGYTEQDLFGLTHMFIARKR